MRADSARVRPSLTALVWRKIFVGDIGGFLGEIVCRPQISAEESHLPVHVVLENDLPMRVGKPAMNLYRGRAGDGCDLPRSFAALLETAD